MVGAGHAWVGTRLSSGQAQGSSFLAVRKRRGKEKQHRYCLFYFVIVLTRLFLDSLLEQSHALYAQWAIDPRCYSFVTLCHLFPAPGPF